MTKIPSTTPLHESIRPMLCLLSLPSLPSCPVSKPDASGVLGTDVDTKLLCMLASIARVLPNIRFLFHDLWTWQVVSWFGDGCLYSLLLLST